MKLKKEHGSHIIADLYGCDFSFFVNKNKREIKTEFSKIILKNSLHELGSFYHFFSGITSFTAIISLAESHLAVHTWPEEEYVSLDIFVCNYSRNQYRNAKNIFKELLKIFKPKKIISKVIKR